MPELPEVETIVRQLRPQLVGKKFWSVEGKVRSTFLPSFEKLSHDLHGLRILDITRRGKFIVFELAKEMCLVIHLRMSGRLLWKKLAGKEKHIRAVFHFSDGTSLIFADARKFGRIWLYHQKEIAKASGISRLGMEPFGEHFTFENFLQLLKRRRGILKNTLLRQDLIAGIGNIYADEICFRIGIHPQSRLEKMSAVDFKKLYEAILYCLEQGIQHNGASVSDFVGTKGTLGKHQLYLQVYGRKDDPCYRCKATIQKTKAAGRGTFVCVKCQVLKD